MNPPAPFPTTGAVTDEKRALLARLLAEVGIEAPAEETIPRRASDEGLPLSFVQQRFLFLQQLEPDSAHYNVPVALRLRGPLRVGVLSRALDALVERHEVLRTTFPTIAGHPRQVVGPPAPGPLPIVDVSQVPAAAREAAVRRLLRAWARQPFTLARGPLLRTRLLRLGAEEHVLGLTMHHVVSDAWSMEIVARELGAEYAAFCGGEASPLGPPPLQYADYAVWERTARREEQLRSSLDYWTTHLAGAPPLELPTGRPRPAIQRHAGATQSFVVPEAIAAELRQVCRREGVTLFMAALAAFAMLLHRATDQDDLVIGTPISGRLWTELEPMLGCFLNTLALRLRLEGNPTCAQVLRQARDVALAAYAHQEVPFERVIDALQPQRDLSRSPVVQVLLVVRHAPAQRWGLSGVTVQPEGVETASAKFDLSLALTEAGQSLRGGLTYATDVFDDALIARLGRQFVAALGALVREPSRPVRDVALIDDVERQAAIQQARGPCVARPEACVHDLVARQAAATPSRIAVMDETRQLTYRELDDLASGLAAQLVTLGAGPDRLVAVCLERSVLLAAALLAVWKAGAAYVPLDPAYPRERLQRILEDGRPIVTLVTPGVRDRLPDDPGPVLSLDANAAAPATAPVGAPAPAGSMARVTPANLAYVIYTSGSTGRPKGVMIEHRSAAEMLEWARETYPDEAMACVLAGTSICFDLSVFELFAPLVRGGAVLIARDVTDLAALPPARGVTLVNTVPSALAELLRLGALPAGVRAVTVAGEPLPAALVDQVHAAVPMLARMDNLYGPTEDTTYSTGASMRPGVAPVIGRPLTNGRAYVLDRHGALRSGGLLGDLHLGGAGLARGYWRQPAMTAERFVPDPFSGIAGARLYRTGDLVRWNADGALEFSGRADQQVKVRGHRIELGEIELALERQPGVARAAVVLWEPGDGDRRLAAYVEGAPDLDPAALRGALRDVLPGYMTPATITVLARLPVTPNGKIDRRALPPPVPAPREAPDAAAAPLTPLEVQVAGIWAEVLGLPSVELDDNFFDLGGDSLLAMRVIAHVNETFGVDVPIRALFTDETLRGLAHTVQALHAAS